mmetsp:Transcript_11477/g.22550  ORF Transcript_11477/g.22550 Transcript_11477/m.22550 type:complete len:831 (-) Transcript_11477:29-2521(-)
MSDEELEPHEGFMHFNSLRTPQFTDRRQEFFRYSSRGKDDSFDELPAKYTNAICRARESGKLRLELGNSNKYDSGGLNHLIQEQNESPTDLSDYQLREEAEDAVNSVKQTYSMRLQEIMRHFSPDGPLSSRGQAEDIEDTMVSHSPIIPFTADAEEKMFSSINSLEDLKRFDKWRTEELNKLREEVARLKRRVHETITSKASKESLSRNSLVSLLKEALKDEEAAEMPEQLICNASEAVKKTCDKELADREEQLKIELSEQFREEKEAIKTRYEEQINLAIAETQEQLNKLWQRRIQSLENRLRYGNAREKQDLAEEIMSYYQSQLEERLEEESVRMRQEIETRKREELAKLSKQGYKIDPKAPKVNLKVDLREHAQAELETMQSQLEQEFEQRLVESKEAWKQQLSESVMRDLRQRFDSEHAEALAMAEDHAKEEANQELEAAVREIRAEAQDAVKSHVMKVNEHAAQQLERLKSAIFEDCMQELSTEDELRAQEQRAMKLRAHIERELKNELRNRLYREIRAKCEEDLRQKVFKAEEAAILSKRKHLASESKHKVKVETEKLGLLQDKEVKSVVDERVARQKRELRQAYKQKLEQFKRDLVGSLENELEDRVSLERQDLKEELTELGQIKAALNSQLKKAATERKEELERIRQEERTLVSKLEEVEIQLSKLQDNSYIEVSKESTGKIFSPGRTKERPLSQQTTLFPKDIEERPRANVASSIGLRSFQISNTTSVLQSHERPFEEPKIKTPKRLLSHYDSSEIVSQLIEKNLKDAAKSAQRELTIQHNYETPKNADVEQHKEAPRSATPTKPRHKLYAELLQSSISDS